MNPRLFCRESSYHKALLLTFSFDPVFFEQIVLPDLWAGRSGDIVVIGDRAQIESSTQVAAGHLSHLGRHYLLARANHAGAFHPKVMLRVGPKDGAIMIGSGNVTSSGWGGNQELGTAWMIGPEYPDKGEWLHQFLEDVLSWCDSELEKEAVRRIKDAPWLSLTPAVAGKFSPVLYSHAGLALGTQISRRWEDRQFDAVKILTGSTDESGAFLRWAHNVFGIQRATVVLTPSMASFVPEKLNDLPVELRLIEAPVDRPLHAKFYWFDGPNGAAAVMGSANCSAAAWLLAPDRNGNVETVVVYDDPDPVQFESALTVFSGDQKIPAELLVSRQDVTNDQIPSKRDYDIKSLRWSGSERSLEALVHPEPSPEATLDLILGGSVFKMHSSGTRGWKCELSEGLPRSTVFASIRITQGSQSWITLPHWIDDLATLEHASQSARLIEPFRGLDQCSTSNEQRAILDDLNEVARTLFHEASSFRDPSFGASRQAKSKEEVSNAPINPQDLVLHLDGGHDPLMRLGSSHAEPLSITGILRLLFDSEGEEQAAAGDEKIDEGQIPDNQPMPDDKKKSKKDPDTPIEDRFRDRLAQQISEFLAELSSLDFAERCTATQMVQAVSFPLAVALRGRRRGWVTEDQSEQWALSIFSIIFRGPSTGKKGLLNAVEERYAENDHLDTFREVVGDGTLWLVLVATLANARWHGEGTDMDKAIALREVFNSSQLIASATQNRIDGLLGRIRIDDARSYVTEVAPKISGLLDQIEQMLRPVWEEEIRIQTEERIVHKIGDLLWRENSGWAICLEDADTRYVQKIRVRLRGLEKEISCGYYVNVTQMSSESPGLNSLITSLREHVLLTKAEQPSD